MQLSSSEQIYVTSILSFQLLEELHEKEKNSGSLQNYATLLLQRIMDDAPNLLQSVIHLKMSEQQPNT